MITYIHFTFKIYWSDPNDLERNMDVSYPLIDSPIFVDGLYMYEVVLTNALEKFHISTTAIDI